MKILHTIRKWIDTITMGACIFLFALMVGLGSYQIITRYFFNAPSTFSEELLTYSFTCNVIKLISIGTKSCS